MHRFFVSPHLLNGQSVISLPEKLAHQVRDVLHLGIGEQLVLLDNSGDEVMATVAKSSRAVVEVEVGERRAGTNESPVRIMLCQGMLKSARFEWILEKGTELGVSVFAPILCHRSMSGLEDAGAAKIQRWQRILQEAAEQCGRSRLPELLPIRQFKQALQDIPQEALALIPWEDEHKYSLRNALEAKRNVAVPLVGTVFSEGHDESVSTRGTTATGTAAQPAITVVLFIGPEGGWTAEEITLAQQYSVQPVSLGRRILRAETAALAAVANVMYVLEPAMSQGSRKGYPY